MSTFWSSVISGTVGAILSAAAVAAVGELQPLGLHLIIPENAVVLMSGPCPAGWRDYEVARAQYLLMTANGASDSDLRAAGAELISPNTSKDSSAPHGTQRLLLPTKSAYFVFSLCQRR